MATAAFWDKAAQKYAASPIKDMAAYEATLTRTRAYLSPTDHLLEVGCGTGSTALKLADAVARITATDISGEMLAIAEGKRTTQGVANVTFRKQEITTPFPDTPYDAVCAFSILHLVDDLEETLMHLRDALKPGGYVISKTACLKEMNIAIRMAIPVMRAIGLAPHVLRFSASELERTFERCGFALVETGYFGSNTYARFIVAQKA